MAEPPKAQSSEGPLGCWGHFPGSRQEPTTQGCTPACCLLGLPGGGLGGRCKSSSTGGPSVF